MFREEEFTTTEALFPAGEVIKYDAHYGFITAGEATISLDKAIHEVNGKKCFKVDIVGKTAGIVSLFKVHDTWQSFIDVQSHVPQMFYRNINENKYKKVETVMFDQNKGKAMVRWKTNDKPEKTKDYVIPQNVQDMVSGYYFLRKIRFENLKQGDTVKVNAFFEDKVYDFKVIYKGRDVVKTKFGKKDSFVLVPIMPENGVFDGKDAVKMWVSADALRVPVKVRAELWVGAVEIEITEYKNDKVVWKKN